MALYDNVHNIVTALRNPYRFICQALMQWLVFSVVMSCYTSLEGEACVRSFLRPHAGRLSFLLIQESRLSM